MRHSWLAWALTSAVLTAPAWSASPADDTSIPQSPARPAPEWFQAVDQGTLDPALKGLHAPAGWKIDVIAQEPLVINPVGMTFGPDGTFYVLEWPVASGEGQRDETVTYKDGTTRVHATMWKPIKDKVKILDDADGDGKYDSAKEIIHDAELPSSILIHDGWVYLTGRGSVFRYKSSKNDGVYDVKEEIIRGFCGYHHHQASGMTIGPDGLLYITSGDDDNYAEGADGSRVTVLRTGVIVRCQPDGTKLEEFAMGFRNPYRDLVFDDRYNLFHLDNDNEDGSKYMGCRLLHLVERGDYGWRLYPGAVCCRPDHFRGAINGEVPGRLPFMLKTGRGSPAGLLLLYGDTFPDAYQGYGLYPDVFRKVIRAYHWQPKGATFEVTNEFEFLKSDDPLFRPCQCVLGPDGAIYVCDWRTDSGGAGRLYGDGQHGRIYRMRWVGDGKTPEKPLHPRDSWRRLAKASEKELVETLRGPSFDLRHRAHLELARRGRQDLLLEVYYNRKEPTHSRVHALVSQTALWNDDAKKAALAACNEESADFRRLAADLLGRKAAPGDADAIKALEELTLDVDPTVRRSGAIALAKVAGPAAIDRLFEGLTLDAGDDAYLTDGFVRAFEIVGAPAIERILPLALGEAPFRSVVAHVVGDRAVRGKRVFDRAFAIDMFLRFRTRPAADALPMLLRAPGLTTDQRVAIIRSFGNYLFSPPVSLDPLVDYVLHVPSPPEVERAALDVVREFGGIKEGTKVDALLARLIDSPNAELRLSVIQCVGAIRAQGVADRLMTRLDRQDLPENERLEILKVARDLRNKGAANAIEGLVKSVRERAARIEALRALATIDEGRARKLAEGLLDSEDLALQQEAIRHLGAKPDGAKLVAERFLAKKLPRETLATIAEVLRERQKDSPELGKLLEQVMKSGLLIDLNPEEAKKIEELVAKSGNPIAGRNIFTDAKAVQCAVCHRLENVGNPEGAGPALTRVWETQSLPKLLESILEPSKEVKEGYQTYVVVESGGRTVTGLLKAKGDDIVVLKDEKGVDVKIPTDEIEAMKPSPQSLMPQNVVANLSYQEFIDLVAFLKNKDAQEGLKRYPGQWWVAGPWDGGLEKAHGPETQTSLDAPAATASGKSTPWEPLASTAEGGVDFRKRFNRDFSTAFAMGHVFADADQPVRARFAADGSAKIWLNGQAVESAGDSVTLPFKKGWNRVVIAVATEKGPQGFRFQLDDAVGVRFGNRPE